jgi:hypothetical protein
MSAREVVEDYFIRAAGATSCAHRLACRKGATELLAALDAAGLEVRPKQQDRVKTLRRWVQATAKEGER